MKTINIQARFKTGPIQLEYTVEGLNEKQFEEWEDYKESKTYYYITSCGEVTHRGYSLWGNVSVYDKKRIEIGNYFETKEEAEKAVEKLKAWKRLKDKGAEFYGWRRNQTGTYELYLRWEDRIPRSYEVKNDLDLLFGGEE